MPHLLSFKRLYAPVKKNSIFVDHTRLSYKHQNYNIQEILCLQLQGLTFANNILQWLLVIVTICDTILCRTIETLSITFHIREHSIDFSYGRGPRDPEKS